MFGYGLGRWQDKICDVAHILDRTLDRMGQTARVLAAFGQSRLPLPIITVEEDENSPSVWKLRAQSVKSLDMSYAIDNEDVRVASDAASKQGDKRWPVRSDQTLPHVLKRLTARLHSRFRHLTANNLSKLHLRRSHEGIPQSLGKGRLAAGDLSG